MKILTWNVAGLPNKINILGNPIKKVPFMLDKMLEANPQIICLQEVFCYKLQNILKYELDNLGYQTHTSLEEGIISKNGLLTATSLHIDNYAEKDYSMYTGAEYLIKKGLLTTYLRDKEKNINLIIHNTHLQSNSIYHMSKTCTHVRQQQKKEMIELISKDNDNLNILCGDLNDDFLTLEHQNFLQELPFETVVSNSKKIITFPKYNQQLDYIIFNKNMKVEYKKINVTTQKISDHEILIADFTIPENLLLESF